MDHTALRKSLESKVDAVVARSADVFGAVLGVHDARDGFQWSGAAGTAYAGKPDPMWAGTPIFVASITKMYVAAATLILEERGRLSLDDPLFNYLPAGLVDGLHRYKGRDYSRQLAVYHLVSQTSGLPDYFTERPKGGQSISDLIMSGVDPAWDLEQVVSLAKNDLSPRFPPEPEEKRVSGKKAYYSDTNYQLLGAVLEAVAERSLPALLDELIIEPLGLASTYLFGHGRTPASSRQAPATVYYKDKPLPVERTMRSTGPDGGLISTVADGLAFLEALMRGELFTQAATLERMKSWRSIFFPFQYGLGLMRSNVPRIMSPFSAAPELLGHSGSTGAFLFHNPDDQLYLAGTLNQIDNPGRPFRFMLRIVNVVREAVARY